MALTAYHILFMVDYAFWGIYLGVRSFEQLKQLRKERGKLRPVNDGRDHGADYCKKTDKELAEHFEFMETAAIVLVTMVGILGFAWFGSVIGR